MEHQELIGLSEILGEEVGENQVISGSQLEVIYVELEMKLQSHLFRLSMVVVILVLALVREVVLVLEAHNPLVTAAQIATVIARVRVTAVQTAIVIAKVQVTAAQIATVIARVQVTAAQTAIVIAKVQVTAVQIATVIAIATVQATQVIATAVIVQALEAQVHQDKLLQLASLLLVK